ncbi:uncharacterized protein LOC127739062 [Mytilus californianus]|uniref:uncharacterized protein LOC127739062 n=1 Tax=Mytilus californianus TaxID=6549 RepID=UPI0022463A20|nr:uncharacterized protein LOC127739062 [Mytilus californianus]
MASSAKRFCTICDDDAISNEAVTWCTECDVLLCSACEKPHRKSRLSKNHKTMLADYYAELPPFIQEISSQCKDHDTKFELYCSFHDCPCCVNCITDKHQQCQEMKPLSDILSNFKSSASVHHLQKDLEDLKENLYEAIKYLETRISINNIQKKNAIEEIRNMRKSIDDYLNKLEQKTISALESTHANLKSNKSTLIQQMEQRACQIEQCQNEFSKMIQYATELQMYIGLREIEKTTSQIAKYIDDLKKGDHLYDKDVEVRISSPLQSILQGVKSFGDINIITRPSTLRVKTRRNDQAQHLLLNIPDVEQIKPSFLKILTIPDLYEECSFVGACLVLPDSNFLILSVHSRKLLLFSNDGIFMNEVITFTKNPSNACFIQNDKVAVTFQTLNFAMFTELVDIKKKKIIKTIKLSHDCCGVASDGKILVISSKNKSTKVNLSDMSLTILGGVRVGHISLFKEKIYGTIDTENKLCCYTSTGEHIWTFQHHDIAEPLGLTLDKHGLVYIVSNHNSSIVVVSPDGKTCKTILSKTDGVKSPYAIDINREKGLMIVSSDISGDFDVETSDSACIYEIQIV